MQEFINKAIKVHGDKYDYSKVEYKLSKDKIIIICKIHGEFKQILTKHLYGDGCKKCGTELAKQKNKLSLNTFIERSNLKHNNKYDYSNVNYVNAHTHIIIICPIHGEFKQTPAVHLSGYGCKKCKKCKKYKFTTNEFIIESKKIHKEKYDYSLVQYKGCEQKIKIICKNHGIFEQIPKSHLYGMGCRKCGQELTGKKMVVHMKNLLLDLKKFMKINMIILKLNI